MDGSVPLVVFIGDGVSDLAAAREADVLFARKGLRLEEYCIENNIPFVPYDTFLDIKRDLQRIIKENEDREIAEEKEAKEAKELKESRKPEVSVTGTPVNNNFWDVSSKDKVSLIAGEHDYDTHNIEHGANIGRMSLQKSEITVSARETTKPKSRSSVPLLSKFFA